MEEEKRSLRRKSTDKVRTYGADFRDFIMRGNVVDIAVGLTVGVGFNSVVTSLVNDIIMPPIAFLTGSTSFDNMYFVLSRDSYDSLEEVMEAGVPVIMYGNFLSQLVDFLIIALSVFFVIKLLSRLGMAKLPAKKTK